MIKKFLALVLVLSMANMASAGLIVSLKAVGKTKDTTTISADGKSVSLGVGSTDTITFELYALPGEGGATDGLTTMVGGVFSNQNFATYPAAVPPVQPGPYAVTGAWTSTARNASWDQVSGTLPNGKFDLDLNGDGVADVGSTSDTSAQNWIQLRADVAPAMDPPSGGFLVWSGTMAVTAGSPANVPLLLDYKIRNAANAATWTEGGNAVAFAKSGTNYASGGPVALTVVPEPSTLVLLGLGALALVFVRRK
jgi:hypothetical protein